MTTNDYRKTTIDIQEDIMLAIGQYREQVAVFIKDCKANAKAEADYKAAYNSNYIVLCSMKNKMPVAEKEARAEDACADLYTTWKMAEASEKSTRAVMTFLGAKIDALRTQAANTRNFENLTKN